MEYLFFARLFGIVSIILGVGILINIEDSKALAKDLISTSSGYILGGVLPTIFGAWVLLHQSFCKHGWSNATVLVGFFMIFICIYRLWFPRSWTRLMNRHIEEIPFLFALFGLGLGILLLYVGFISSLL